MGFWKRLRQSLMGGEQKEPGVLRVHVRCKNCGEAIMARVSLSNDLSVHYDENGRPQSYYVRKTIVGGSRRCYQPVKVALNFDSNRRLADQEIDGGEFITAEEYRAETS